MNPLVRATVMDRVRGLFGQRSKLEVNYADGSPYPDGLSGAVDAVVRGTVAAVEVVAGRVEAQFMEARVVGSTSARRALNPRILGMVGRSLVEQGESLHFLEMDRMGVADLIPAQPVWNVRGGFRPDTWVIDATLQGADTVRQEVAPRAGWLHVIRSAAPEWPYRGIPAYRRATLTFELAKAAEDALIRESRIPAKAIFPIPGQGGSGQAVADYLRAKIANALESVMFPETVMQNRAQAPQTDWKAQRVTPQPDVALVQLAGEVQGRVIAALGGHPALGGAGKTGAADREARKQLLDFLVYPLGVLVSHEASLTFDELVSLQWDVQDDVRLTRARTAQTLLQAGVKLNDAMVEAGFPGWPREDYANVGSEPGQPQS